MRRPEAAADDDDLRGEDVRERADRERRGSGRSAPSAARASAIALACLADELVRVGLAAPELACRPLRRLAGRDGLEVAAAVAVALARRAVRLHDDVAELGPAAVQPPVEHDAAPTPVPSARATRSVRPRPAPSRHSASAIALPSFSSPTGMPKRSWSSPREVERCEGQVDRAEGDARPAGRCSSAPRRRCARTPSSSMVSSTSRARRGTRPGGRRRRHLDRPRRPCRRARGSRRGSSSRRRRRR